MSVLGSLQTKLTELGHKGKGWQGKLADPLGISPHEAAYEQQQEMDQRAAELEAQQAADAARASEGPQAMGLRPQAAGQSVSAGGVSGMSLFEPRPRRTAARRSIQGY